MAKKIFSIVFFICKGLFILSLILLGLHFYNDNKAIHLQNIAFFTFVLFPAFAGYEAVIKTIIERVNG